MALLSVECKFVTEDCIREWKTAGSNFKLQAPVPVARFIYELCWTLVRGELPFSKCRIALDSVEFSEKQGKEDAASIFADTVAHMGQELTLPGECRGRLIELAKWLVESGLIPIRLLHERCEAEFLWESEMVKIKAAELKAKEVRVNTRLLYQQTKFNLLREESEGYAKLVTLLCQCGSGGLTHRTASAAISTIKSLIGHFDLDPNRVFDIVLECFELQPENDAFLELIPIFPKSHAAHILGFKFQYYQRLEVNGPVPDGLYRLTAQLVKADFIDLDNIYAHLLPKDEEAFEHYEEISKKRLDEANKIGKINLAATGKDLKEEEKPGDVTIDLFAALDLEIEAGVERSTELVTNQKLGLLKGFLAVDDWFHAHLLLDRLSPLNAVSHKPVCDGLFRVIERAISSSYAVVRPSLLLNLGSSYRSVDNGAIGEGVVKYTGQGSSFIELPRELFQMLASVGPYLYRDALLLQKVCRALRGYYSSALALVASSESTSSQDLGVGERRDPRFRLKEARLNVEEALGTCLLPSLQLIPANPAVGQEIWEVMSLLPYEARYRLYGEWEKDDERIPVVLAARLTAKLDTRRILKRLAKENLKQLGRMVAKIAHANPMTVLRTIVHQIEAYKDMITPVVDAFKYLTQLEYDVLEYVVIERLAQGGREKLKEDGLNLSDWLQSLASFWGHLCKKYPSMELRGLFQYLVNQLKRGEGIELLLLQELIQQMANVQYTENMTEEQLDAMAGGETLRYQATSFGIMRNNKALIKSTSRLRDALLPKDEPKLAVPLLCIIAQHRSIVVIKADAPHIKMVSEQFDRCHGTLLQYVEFLISAVTPLTAYAQLIPTLDDLAHKYHLDPEVAFLIYRPIMRLFKPSRGSEICWPADMSKALAQLDGSKEVEHCNSSSELVLDLGSNRKPLTWSDLLGTVHSMLPSKAWNSLSPELYATFWGLTLYDLYVPRKRYESEITKQHAALKALEEISDNSHTAIAKRKKDKERIQELLDRLTGELQKQEQNVAAVHQRLVREKDTWLTSCPDSLKINMEFLQRCIFPRCVLSMPDAVYCAKFVHSLHSLGTPFFNTVNHIDVLICKALPPMICCCTEFEAGRLGRFLYETLKMAYYWKKDESIYERECGNMPGFAVYYRDPNSQRVTFAQYIKVHWKWSGRITRLLIQCLESNEYMDIRNALIILTKISSVFPVTRKTGFNLEKRVSKIKADEREDLKVLATGVAAALAARKSAWVSEEEFNMGYVDIKPSASPAKQFAGTSTAGLGSVSVTASHLEPSGMRNAPANAPLSEAVGSLPDQKSHPVKTSSVANSDVRLDRSESMTPIAKSELLQSTIKSLPVSGSADSQSSLNPGGSQAGTNKASIAGTQKKEDEPSKGPGVHQATAGIRTDESSIKGAPKLTATESESRSQPKRANQTASIIRQSKTEPTKDDSRSGKGAGRVVTASSTGDRDPVSRTSETRQGLSAGVAASNGGTGPAPGTVKASSISAKVPQETVTNFFKTDTATTKTVDLKVPGEPDVDRSETQEASGIQKGYPPKSPHDEEALLPKSVDDFQKDKQQKRPNPVDETDRLNKRRKGDNEDKGGEFMEIRGLDQRSMDKPRTMDQEKSGPEDRILEKAADKSLDRPKERVGERIDRDHRGERPERSDKSRGEEHAGERTRDRSMERFRERSVDRAQDRGPDRNFERSADRNKDERNKDDRNRSRFSDSTAEKPHPDDRFPMQSLPPPPPLPPNVVPQSLPVGRREDEIDRRGTSNRPMQRLSPRREEKIEKKRSEEGSVTTLDESKRRREDEHRKREERENLLMKAWTSTSWNHQQASEFTGNNTGVNNEQDWAARARAWAAAKAAMEAQQAQPQFTPLGRTAEHQVYQDHYSQPVQTQFSEVHQPSLPAVGHQNVQLPSVPVPNMATNQAQDFTTHYHTDLSSSYNHDGFMSYSLKDGAATHEQNASVNSSQGSIPTISPSYSQEMVTNYTSVSGVEEQVKPRQTSHSPLSSPMTLVQDDQLSQVQVQSASTTQIPSQSTQQPHFTYSDQQVPPAHEVNHQQSEFEHVGHDYHQLQQSGYLQPVPTVAMEGQEYNGPPPSVAGWPQLGGPSAPFPSVPPVLSSSHQFDHPYMSVPHPIPGPPAHLFGRVPGPQPGPGFRPNMPPIGGPFGIGPGSPGLPPGPAGMVGPAFMGENNGAFGVPERPKKASVPNWLREELMKKKAAVVANTSAQGLPSEDSFHASGSEDANRSFRKADLTDSKSIDSGRSSDDEDDEEDELEAARTAAINQEIKRVLTEVLLKVTDDLFDEIAEEVLDEDDHSAQVKKHVASDRGRMRIFSKSSPPPPPVQTPMASARVLVSASNATSGNGDDTEKSNSSAPGENLLGLANYASDEDDETVQTRQHVSSQGPEQQEGGLLEDRNREEHGGQVSAGEKSVDEKSKDDRQVDAGEYHDNPRSKGQAKDVVVNKDAGVAAEEHEKIKETLIPHAPKSVDKERHQASSKFAHSEFFFDKGRPNDLKDREIKSKGNDKHDIRKGVSVVNSEPGEIKSKKGDSKQVDFSQHRKDGEKDREKEKEKDREREREKVKEREKIRVGDKKRDKIRDQEGRKGSDKESRKDHEKEKRTAEKIDDVKKIDKERGEKNGKGRQRDNKDTGKNRKRSSSVSSRGRNGKVDSYDSNNSSSGADETENTKRRRVRSSRRSSSPSPIRSRKRQVSRSRSRSRSSHARHSHRRHSPYPSHEGRHKQSRSGSPVRRRR